MYFWAYNFYFTYTSLARTYKSNLIKHNLGFIAKYFVKTLYSSKFYVAHIRAFFLYKTITNILFVNKVQMNTKTCKPFCLLKVSYVSIMGVKSK